MVTTMAVPEPDKGSRRPSASSQNSSSRTPHRPNLLSTAMHLSRSRSPYRSADLQPESLNTSVSAASTVSAVSVGSEEAALPRSRPISGEYLIDLSPERPQPTNPLPNFPPSSYTWESHTSQRDYPNKKSDFEVAWEMAREQSLLDIDNPDTMHPLAQEQLNAMSLGPPEVTPQRDPGSRASRSSVDQSSFPSGGDKGARKTTPRRVKCDDCQIIGEDRYFCNVCNETFCNDCWNRERKHRNDHRTADGVPHEKTNHIVARTIHTCLQPPEEDKKLKRHAEDEKTTWFGVMRDQIEELLFEDFGRYAAVLAEGSVDFREPRFPGLVSFVGQTGAGKSTIIKVLIEVSYESRKTFESPVVGSVNVNLPTSGDVHLYKDPQTFLSKYPTLYADCEGLDGGGREPMGAKSRHKEVSKGERTPSFQKRMRRLHHSSKREILWANTAETRTREYAVKNLYPRLLFTFSDSIVFVSKNARVIENTIEKLVEWAAAALETSSNQPVLPHLIIALNASEPSVDVEQYDVDVATRIHTEIPIEVIKKNPKLQPFIKFWQDRRKDIRSAMDLLLSYYMTVRVVRIPTGARPKILHEQITKLYSEIQFACKESRDQKRKLRMLLSADELQPYLQSAFDHFSSTLNHPFDFVKASINSSSIPNDFGGSILRMAINIMQVWENKLDAANIFIELSALVASCIMLDSVRKKIPGGAGTIFPQYYMGLCDDALEDFCDQHWPCEYFSRLGRCVNVKNGHNCKGHQLSNGKVFAVGPYQSSFSPGVFRNKWRSLIFQKLDSLLKMHSEALSDHDQGEEDRVAYALHQTHVLGPFFRHVGSATKFISHSTCYSCLIIPPGNPLPCGHVICTPCLHALGTSRGKCMIQVNRCPLQHPEGENLRWYVQVKPSSAGVRILTLDGGGIRGIAELEVLRLLEKELKGLMPIQAFFDLIVGTSAGGLIALGLGVENWPVSKCIDEFQRLCKGAFTLRKGGRLWGIGALVAAHFHSKYATRPLNEALSETYTDEYLFGGLRYLNRDNHYTKVALTSTSSAGIRPVVLSNYNRLPDDEKSRSYLFHRPENPDAELKIWEAARATSAAPTYYRNFSHEPSKHVFLDGGLLHNNPVVIADAERKLIWPDQANRYPDILLSIGSGFQPMKRSPAEAASPPRSGVVSNLKSLYRIAVDHIESSLDAEQAWQNWMKTLDPDKDGFRFQRLNAHLPYDPPKLDDVGAMNSLQGTVREVMTRDKRIQRIAHHLMATSFFLEQSSAWLKLEDGSLECSSTILCRFTPQSQEIRDFGKLLQDFMSDDHMPYFVIVEKYLEREAQQVVMTPEILHEMVSNGRFSMLVKTRLFNEFSETNVSFFPDDVGDTLSAIQTEIRDGTPLGYPISGFPRRLKVQPESMREVRSTLGGNYTSRRRTSSQQKRLRDDGWTPSMMDASVRLDSNPIETFGDANYRVGGASREALELMEARFQFQAPAELPGSLEKDSGIMLNPHGGGPVYEMPG